MAPWPQLFHIDGSIEPIISFSETTFPRTGGLRWMPTSIDITKQVKHHHHKSTYIFWGVLFEKKLRRDIYSLQRLRKALTRWKQQTILDAPSTWRKLVLTTGVPIWWLNQRIPKTCQSKWESFLPLAETTDQFDFSYTILIIPKHLVGLAYLAWSIISDLRKIRKPRFWFSNNGFGTWMKRKMHLKCSVLVGSWGSPRLKMPVNRVIWKNQFAGVR